MNSCIYTHLIFDKSTQNIWWRKDNLFKKCGCENWVYAWRKLKLDSCLSSYTSINSKWIKNLNTRPETKSESTQGRGEDR
jgi:hypothetical protein